MIHGLLRSARHVLNDDAKHSASKCDLSSELEDGVISLSKHKPDGRHDSRVKKSVHLGCLGSFVHYLACS
jgi:hypothetical protein